MISSVCGRGVAIGEMQNIKSSGAVIISINASTQHETTSSNTKIGGADSKATSHVSAKRQSRETAAARGVATWPK